ncbi:hypothetical protein NDU88_004195 [Pleurodeles waltl]|uniref:Uncharacterized protein n=1 Tax=Pleurodeles waltl TaxID=8319 RepID=A0AAV7WXH6_PLEWA|nr:hypothetical protein NDU88_004195 [Pleurodeles waltl]
MSSTEPGVMCGALLLPVSEISEAVSDPDVCSVGQWACTRHSRVQPVESRKEQRTNCPYRDYAERKCPAVRAPPFLQPQCTYCLIAVLGFTAVCAPFDNLKASGAANRRRLGQPHVLRRPSGALRSVLSVETGFGDIVKSPAAGSAHEDQQPRESGSHFHPLSLQPHSTCEDRHVVLRYHGNRWFSPP